MASGRRKGGLQRNKRITRTTVVTRTRSMDRAWRLLFVLGGLLTHRPCVANTVDGWTESVRVNILQEVLENRYLRSPVALVLDLSPENIRSFKTLWYETAEQGLPDRDVLFYPVNERDVGKAILYDSERLSGVLGELDTPADASAEEPAAGPLLSAVLSATVQLPYDSAALVVAPAPPRDSRLAPTVAEMLIRKRARLYVIWTGEQDSGEEVLKETALLTGGAFYNMETNSVIRTRMLRIESADLDQTIISRKEIVDRMESSFIIPEGDVGFRVKISGNVSHASLIDPQGHARNLLLSANGDEVDEVISSTSGWLAGSWLLLTEGTNNATYDVLVVKELNQGTEVTTIDDVDGAAEDWDEAESEARFRREVPTDVEVNPKLAKLAFPEDGPSNETMKKIVTSGQQKSLTPVTVPLIVELASGSSLEVRPGATTQLQFDVTNNMNLPTTATFTASGRGVDIQTIQPQQVYLPPFGTVKVQLNAVALSQQSGGTGMLTFTVLGAARTTSRSAYLYFTTSSTSDSWAPEMTYTYKGDCRQFEEPATCDNGQWSVEATIKDEESGLLRVMSEPFGLLFGSEFIAGTKSPVTVTYIASCCKPKVDIWAEDLRGNFRRKSFDVFHQGLLDGEIAAIVVGVLLLIIIIALIVVLVLYCRKRKSDRIVLPRHRSEAK